MIIPLDYQINLFLTNEHPEPNFSYLFFNVQVYAPLILLLLYL